MGKRILYLDVVKCFAIYLVIWGHCLVFCNTHWPYYNIAHDLIYSFHMPLFMLVSGFFSQSSFFKDFKTFIKNKIIQLLLPVVFWELIICALIFIFSKDIITIRAEIIGGLWFLRTLFICYVLVYFIKKIHLPDWILCLMSCLFMFLIPRGSFLEMNRLLPFFWMGYFMHKYYDCYRKYRRFVFFCSMFLFIVLFVYQELSKIPSYIPINYQTILSSSKTICFEYLINSSGSLMLFSLVYMFCDKFPALPFWSKLGNWGTRTLGIYTTQAVLVNMLLPRILQIKIDNGFLYEFVITPLVSLIMMYLCILTISILSKNRWCNLLLFGNQY